MRQYNNTKNDYVKEYGKLLIGLDGAAFWGC
jgi:hypothetical protein